MVTNTWSSTIVNSFVSAKLFPVSSGTQQGDPVTGFFFILGIKVLATALCNHPGISGVELSSGNAIKYVMYCDNLTLYLANPPLP
jgi:hypothetical protein